MGLAQAILSCLMEVPQSGYDLSKVFSEAVGYFWHASQQQVYRELGKLEAAGLIVAQTIPREGRLDKKLYSITALGKQHLVEWMQNKSEPDVIREDLLVKIFSGNLVPVSLLLEDIERRRQIHLATLSRYRKIEREEFPHPDALTWKQKLQHLVLSRGIRFELEWIAWCDEALLVLESSPNS